MTNIAWQVVSLTALSALWTFFQRSLTQSGIE